MFENIETKTETTVVRSMVLTLSEAEVNEALINSGKLLKRIRQERAKWFDNGEVDWSQHGRANSRPHGKKAGAHGAAKKSSAASAEQKCPHCGESFRRLARHLPACPNRDGGKPFEPDLE